MPADTINLTATGLERPIKIAHVTDAHLCYADAGDQRHATHLARIETVFGGSSRWPLLLIELRASAPDFIVFTGDLIHSATAANYSHLRESLATLEIPWAATFGNHEWDWPHEASLIRSADWRERVIGRWRDDFGHNPSAHHVALAGALLILIDNSDYQIGAATAATVKSWLGTCQPTLVFVHIPFDEDSLRGPAVAKWGDPILCGATTWSAEGRERWGVAPHDLPSTTETITRLRENPNLLGVFSGHLHLTHKAKWGRSGLQCVTRPAFEGNWTEICLVPEDCFPSSS